MGTDIGVRASGGREAVERIARRRGMAADAMLRDERARARLLFGRGALYRADIMIMGVVSPKRVGDSFCDGAI